jgi:hypothetical protein
MDNVTEKQGFYMDSQDKNMPIFMGSIKQHADSGE